MDFEGELSVSKSDGVSVFEGGGFDFDEFPINDNPGSVGGVEIVEDVGVVFEGDFGVLAAHVLAVGVVAQVYGDGADGGIESANDGGGSDFVLTTVFGEGLFGDEDSAELGSVVGFGCRGEFVVVVHGVAVVCFDVVGECLGASIRTRALTTAPGMRVPKPKDWPARVTLR